MNPSIEQFEFKGSAGEYFRIWIVNIMLSIVTLGIYSAWAKVRTRKYLYGNIILMNSGFDYLAEPMKILKGRLFAFVLFLIYSLSSLISAELQLLILLAIVPIIPWIIIKSMQFNRYNTAYRNIRFHFKADYLDAVTVFIGLGFLVGLSMGLAYPYFQREQKKFLIDHTAFGASHFEMSAPTGQFYKVYFQASLLFIAMILLLGGLSALFGEFDAALFFAPYFAMMIMLLFLPVMILMYSYFATVITNLVINQTRLGDHQLRSSMDPKVMSWIYFSNTLAIMLSFGLLIPWAKIRTINYRISHLSVEFHQQAEQFIAAEKERANAVGEELGEFLDIDLGL